jgi:hypothetical protein
VGGTNWCFSGVAAIEFPRSLFQARRAGTTTAGGDSHRWGKGRTFFTSPSPGLVLWANTRCRAAAAPTGISQTVPKYRLTSNANPKGGWHQLKRWVAPIGVLAILGGRSFGFQDGEIGNECRLRRSDRGPRRLPRHPARTEKKEESES